MNSTRPQPRWGVARGLVACLLAVLAAATLLAFLGRGHWRFDVVAHARPQLAAAALTLALLALPLRAWRLAALAAVVTLVNAAVIAPLWVGGRDPGAATPRITLMHFNVHTSNQRYADVCRVIGASRADLVFVLECNEAWARALETRVQGYSVAPDARRPRQDNFGMLLLVREGLPATIVLESARLMDVTNGLAQVPAIEVRLRVDDRALSVLGLHTLPPVSSDYAMVRDAQLSAAAQWAADQQHAGRSVVVIGDFNTTPWAPSFGLLTEPAGLVNSQFGYGLATSWPSGSWFVRIPIDHAVHSADVWTLARELGEASGSDHRPLRLELGW
ncbi:MAG: endonuclease/exonuclease/phosphatase family protein [Phycisphaeraceae bacterium]